MGSFRFPPSPITEEDAAVAGLRHFASVHRDDALAEHLGGLFAAQAVASYKRGKHVTLDPLISEFSIGSPEAGEVQADTRLTHALKGVWFQ